jgi:hypothetical protein
LVPSDDLLIQHGDDSIQYMGHQLWGADNLGIEHYFLMSFEKIQTEVGWLNDFDAPSFQPFQHAEITRLNYTPWSHPAEFAALDLSNLNPPPNFLSQKAKWVQLVGITSLVSSLFTLTEGPLPESILLADKVGVGKTPCSRLYCFHQSDYSKKDGRHT